MTSSIRRTLDLVNREDPEIFDRKYETGNRSESRDRSFKISSDSNSSTPDSPTGVDQKSPTTLEPLRRFKNFEDLSQRRSAVTAASGLTGNRFEPDLTSVVRRSQFKPDPTLGLPRSEYNLDSQPLSASRLTRKQLELDTMPGTISDWKKNGPDSNPDSSFGRPLKNQLKPDSKFDDTSATPQNQFRPDQKLDFVGGKKKPKKSGPSAPQNTPSTPGKNLRPSNTSY